ncbi:MAG: hypothetical protein KAS01_00725 [Candidatus Pacebacteria bacterium]|nr:hypothetical protein [Candidatus Paceibacterota bacterium]
MNKKTKEKLKMVPSFVRDSMFEDYTSDAIGKIINEYIKEDDNKLSVLKNIIGLTILKDIKIEDISNVIQTDLEYDKSKSQDIALIILREMLFPIASYFPGIEDEILRLGGEIPKGKPKKLGEQLLKREEEMDKMKEEEKQAEAERMADTIISKSIDELSKEFPVVGNQQIGSQESITIKTKPEPMKPLIKYWLEDYKEKMGYYNHSNIERVQYVYHDKNTKSMNGEERRQLNLILKSVDEKILLPYSTKTKKIDFSRIE